MPSSAVKGAEEGTAAISGLERNFLQYIPAEKAEAYEMACIAQELEKPQGTHVSHFASELWSRGLTGRSSNGKAAASQSAFGRERSACLCAPCRGKSFMSLRT